MLEPHRRGIVGDYVYGAVDLHRLPNPMAQEGLPLLNSLASYKVDKNIGLHTVHFAFRVMLGIIIVIVIDVFFELVDLVFFI